MSKESTSRLNTILKDTSFNDMENFIAEYCDGDSAAQFINRYVADNNIKMSDIVKKCDGYISKSYIYEVFNGKKQSPSRDYVLLICMAAQMNLKMTNRTLELFGLPPLYPKNDRDAVIAICINNAVYDVLAVNDRLFELGEDMLFQEN